MVPGVAFLARRPQARLVRLARPPPDGGPPSNWLRYVGDSAWRWDEATGQFYYRLFLDSQPDLNWRNPACQEAMFDTLRFWLARGIDGFRIDALVVLVEDDQLRDNPPNPLGPFPARLAVPGPSPAGRVALSTHRAATASRSAGRWSWRVTRAWSSSSTEGRRDHSATMGRLCPPACREDLRRARHPQ